MNKKILNILDVIGFYVIIWEILNEGKQFKYSFETFWNKVSPLKRFTYLNEYMILLTHTKMIEFSEYHFRQI